MAQCLVFIDEELDKMLKRYESTSDFEYQKKDVAKQIVDKLINFKWKSLEEMYEQSNQAN